MRALPRVPPCPSVLDPDGSQGADERAAAIAHFSAPDWQAREAVKATRFKFTAYRHPDVRDALSKAFRHTCAYCESALDATQPMAIEHFRPKGEVWNGPKKADWCKPGYFWLASTWSNLLPSCTRCNTAEYHHHSDGARRKSGKGNWFPLQACNRATAPGEEAAEKPLLLHPYDDDPHDHLEFVEEAVVRPRKDSLGNVSAKGTTTVEVLGLNRRGLADRRHDRRVVVEAHLRRIAEYEQDIAEHPGVARFVDRRDREIADLRKLTRLGSPHSGMAWQRILDEPNAAQLLSPLASR